MAQLLQGTRNQVRGVCVLVAAHLDGNALVDSTVGRDIQVAAGDLVHGGTHGTREAHNLLHAIILHVVEDEDTLNRDRGTGGLGDRVATGDQLVAGLDADRRLGASARNRGLLRLASLTLDLALVGRVVGAVIGLGRRALAFEASARVSAGADLRALLGALLTDGAELTPGYGVQATSGPQGRARGPKSRSDMHIPRWPHCILVSSGPTPCQARTRTSPRPRQSRTPDGIHVSPARASAPLCPHAHRTPMRRHSPRPRPPRQPARDTRQSRASNDAIFSTVEPERIVTCR